MKILSVILFIILTLPLSSQNIVEFRGKNRSGRYEEKGLLKEWPVAGPELILKIEGFGKGYSQPVFAEGKIFVTGQKYDTVDVLSAYDLNGTLLWETAYGRSWTRSYSETRSTPTNEDNRIYVSSGIGQLNCINATTGEIIWNVDVISEYGGTIHQHGDAECPLIVGELVVFTTGGDENTLVAFNKHSGSPVWKTRSLGGAKSYASPVLAEFEGKKFILVQTTRNLVAADPSDGRILWSYDLIQYHIGSQGKGANTNPALVFNNEVFVTSGYDHPATLFSIKDENMAVELKWKNETFNTHIGGVVMVEGNLYGSNWQHNALGKWVSVNCETGETNWEEEWYNKGSIIFADGMLYLYEEKSGNVALVKPSPESLKIISTFKVNDGEGPHWAHPAIYDQKLFIRHGSVLMVYNLKK
ncbi:MAG: PQQ-binding-like beta-propeller repeat protein [Bacteroidales bacterium]|nr:PQQ-binding-like beta-propeller repeat protein [Bacteroidales bacterium]